MKKILFLFILIFLCNISVNAQIEDCEECGSRLLTKKDVEGLSLETLSFFKNEIYARKGYRFSAWHYNGYFSKKKWYKPTDSNTEISLSKIETQNVDFLKREEVRQQGIRDVMVQDLKELKVALTDSNQVVINRFVSKLFKEEAEYNAKLLPGLKKILDIVDLDAIHWYHGRGLYAIEIDNGFCKSRYGIYIEDNILRVEGSDQMSHSDIFKDSEDVYSYYDSIEEHSEAFIFKMTEDGIIYNYFWAAG